MAVGLTAPAELLPIGGVRLATVSAGIARGERDDVLLMAFAEGSTAAATFTRNAFCAAPVQVARSHLLASMPRFALVNAGNANAGTGEQGLADAKACCVAIAAQANVADSEVLPFSTGVIGQTLPMAKLLGAIERGVARVGTSDWHDAARAIMTTDTLPKGVSSRFETADGTVTMTGIVKGAGMIRPDMATLLVYVATDAAVPHDILQRQLGRAVDTSFNCISVDGDTSTNDSCLLVATGQSGVDCARGENAQAFEQALFSLMQQLAQAVVRDGEGATKFIELQVEGGRSEQECRDVAFTVAHSPLVKTAFFASDANWGRILAAVGRAGLDALDTGLVDIRINDVLIVSAGGVDADYTEDAGSAAMAESEIRVRISLGRGDSRSVVWTTDLSHDYVTINAEYRT